MQFLMTYSNLHKKCDIYSEQISMDKKYQDFLVKESKSDSKSAPIGWRASVLSNQSSFLDVLSLSFFMSSTKQLVNWVVVSCVCFD